MDQRRKYSPALTGVLTVLLDEAKVEFALGLWDGAWCSPIILGDPFCGADFDRCRLRMDASLIGGDLCPKFTRLRWDEREGALATCGVTCDCCC